ncbi:prevent-host-death family protein [Thioploca ingrica]|uniref:Prevent-host-death family protein n=1 Tax=Thioploca ingrica TaxID=40754 RepID=A0A090AIZ8_9GAMM|nr:prevent-host-death family protein [Thioploca ingrica]
MNIYTLSEARQQLSSLLEQAVQLGEVYIRCQDGKTFILKPVQTHQSPLAVPTIKMTISSQEIVDTIREMREKI